MKNEWKPIKTAPAGRVVRVCGDSTYASFRWFDCSAYYNQGRAAWYDVISEPLSDRGWKPIFWKELDPYPREDPKLPVIDKDKLIERMAGLLDTAQLCAGFRENDHDWRKGVEEVLQAADQIIEAKE